MAKKEIKISKTAVNVTKGIAIFLFAVLVILSPGTFFSFLSQGIIAGFGFIGFWVLMPVIALYGIYTCIKKQVKKLRLDLTFLGIIIALAFVSILATNYIIEGTKFVPFLGNTTLTSTDLVILNGNTQVVNLSDGTTQEVKGYLEMSSTFHYFSQLLNDANSGIQSATFSYNVFLAGGFFGFIFDGIFNSLFRGTLGTTILSIVFIVIGLLLIFNRQIKMLWNKIRNREKHEKAPKKVRNRALDDDYEYAYTDDENENEIEDAPIMDESIQDEVKPVNNQSAPIDFNSFNMSINSFNSGNSLKRPTLTLDGVNVQKNPQVSVEEKPVDEAPKQAFSPFGNIYDAKNEEEPPITPDFLNNRPINAYSNDNPVISEDVVAQEPAYVNQNPYVEENPIRNGVDETNSPIEATSSLVKPTFNKPIMNEPNPIAEQKAPEPIKPYVLPSEELLDLHEKEEDKNANTQACDARVEELNRVFEELHVGAKVVGYTVGPSVTRYDLLMNSDRSVSTIDKFIQDLQIRLGGVNIRFEKLVIGKSTSGLEMENKVRTPVGLRECLKSLDPISDSTRYQMIFGKGISGNIITGDITKFPHMLVAGTTGSGKTVFVHAILITLLLRNTPEELKLVLIDPKRVEFNYYKNIPHLLCPSITESSKALVALKKLVNEMERRFELFANNMVNEIKNFNKIAESRGLKKLPIIIVAVDEYADLSEECKEIRTPISRIAQKARAAGIHLILATQRPSVNVIDGVIKSNISTRVALSVSSFEDSRVIIGEGGAEKLLGYGDLLIDSPNIQPRGYKHRVQGCLLETEEIMRVCDFIRSERGPDFDPEFLDLEDHSDDFEDEGISYDEAEPTKVSKEVQEEELYDIIKQDLASKEYCSISYIQRSYGVGFPKAGRLFARLQREGIVAKQGDSSHGCKVLVRVEQNDTNLGSIEQSTLVESTDDGDYNNEY